MHAWKRAAIVAAAVAAAGCGGSADTGYGNGPSTQPTPPGTPGNPSGGVSTSTVTIGTESFDPQTISVPAGTTVTWQWNSCSGDGYGYSTCVSHNVTFDDGSSIASSTQSSGTFSRTFNTAGTYKYHCSIHGAAMTGEVNVK